MNSTAWDTYRRRAHALRDLIDRIATQTGGVVAEGRDITTVVAPDADVRVLLTASVEARLRRRSKELHGHDADHAVEATRDQIVRRDADDSTVSEFTEAAEGVHLVDTSDLDFEQSVAAVVDVCIRVPSEDTPRIQELCMLLGHTLCELIEHELTGTSDLG